MTTLYNKVVTEHQLAQTHADYVSLWHVFDKVTFERRHPITILVRIAPTGRPVLMNEIHRDSSFRNFSDMRTTTVEQQRALAHKMQDAWQVKGSYPPGTKWEIYTFDYPEGTRTQAMQWLLQLDKANQG